MRRGVGDDPINEVQLMLRRADDEPTAFNDIDGRLGAPLKVTLLEISQFLSDFCDA